ncbi:ATP-binding protein [Pokkaliibacter sp. CJK22405]|uniref:ATP-binding protein n=1 Tax=Pokkaliibacter sp. CJK22405 TaxID=3384615 RepID=UPI003984C797
MPPDNTQPRDNWRPRTLLQMVFLGFFVVMAPLLFLIYQTTLALDHVSTQMQAYSQSALQVTQRGQQLVSLSVELERTARQYQVVKTDELLSIFTQQRQRFIKQLQIQRESVHELAPLFDQLMISLDQLPPLLMLDTPATTPELNALLDRINDQAEAMRAGADTAINQQLDALNHFNEDERNRLLISATVLMGTSLLLMVLASLVITRPVRRLEKMITLLGQGKQLSSKPIGGPAELSRLAGKLHWLDSQLSTLDQQKKQFLRHMSHELKTPLASMREGTDLLAEGVLGPLNDNQQEVVGLMQSNSQQLQQLIEQLLDYNMLHQSLPTSMSSVAIPKLFDDLLARYQLTMNQKVIHCEQVAGPESWNADEHKLRRCLDNLISNAVHYGKDDGKLLIEWSEKRNHLIIDIANTGQPISDTDKARIFEPFYQGQARRHGPLKGSGIGLSVARDCIEAQGGSLTLQTKNGFDVCFRVELPHTSDSAAVSAYVAHQQDA